MSRKTLQRTVERSVRFFPKHHEHDSDQIIGFLEMINYILEIKPEASHWVEIGSHIGEAASLMLGFPNIKRLDCVDDGSWVKDSFQNLTTRTQQHITENRCFLHQIDSISFSQKIPDNYADVIYIDARHKYESVKQDIEVYFSKVKQGGFFCGHDYNPEQNKWPGVIRAVDEFSSSYHLPIKRFRDSSWLFLKE